ncbi:hypothetical protein ZIOFF_069149 [Zingiber officinale]|uniref:DEP domain-containing protein n=1 Tax=Zingiber officinale TaxID=94328 RepID=A0A8J5C3G4_ZINOF|nr:hypothetical protein ZIOFF_069149 [Zingiber officinale]
MTLSCRFGLTGPIVGPHLGQNHRPPARFVPDWGPRNCVPCFTNRPAGHVIGCSLVAALFAKFIRHIRGRCPHWSPPLRSSRGFHVIRHFISAVPERTAEAVPSIHLHILSRIGFLEVTERATPKSRNKRSHNPLAGGLKPKPSSSPHMEVSMKNVDSAFHGVGQKAGLEIWRIENFCPVTVPSSSHGKFFTGDSYIVLKTTALKSGALRHDIHYWLGKDTTQDEAGTAAIKTVELDAALGGRAVQYRELQGHESEKFLSYFKPCIIPQQGGILSGFKHAEINEREHVIRLFVCRGKHVVHVKEVPFARSSLNHDDIFILDTKSKIFQFNGSNSSIQERAKALEVVQYLKDTYHEGKCEMAAVEDGKLMADAEAGEFWGFFGGFAPLPRKAASEDEKKVETFSQKLLRVEKGQPVSVEAESLTRDLLDTNKCYLLDCGTEIYVWMGRNTSLDERKTASSFAEDLLRESIRSHAHFIRVIEGFETVVFRSKFDKWTQTSEVTVTEDGRGKVAALLKRQGLNVKGLTKAAPVKEEPQPYIDCTGNLQVWRVDGKEKTLLSQSDQSKFFSGDCYIFQYAFPGDDKEEYLIGNWFGKKSIEVVILET